VTLLTGVLFSLAPVWQATRVELSAAIRQGLRSTACSATSLPRLLAGKSLVVFQVALCVVLLVGAGLFVRTLANLKSAELGFRPERLLLFSIDPPRTRYTGEHRRALFEQLEGKIAQVPGVQSSTLSWVVLVANSNSTTRALPEGREGPPGPADRTWVNIVGDRFFETMGIPILSGRPIGPGDRPNAPHVAVVNQRFARDFFPQRNALGRTFRNGNDTLQIVGICGDTHYDQIRTDIPRTFYRPFQQVPDLGDMTFELKTAASEASIIRAVRGTVRSVDSDLPVFDIRTQTQQIDDTLSNERLFAALASAFGALALVLAAVGIYGIIAYGAARRTGEIGIRMALGACRRDVLAMILRETVVVAIAGAGIGGLAALGLTRYLRSMLYGLRPSDPLTLGGAILLIFAVAIAAGWLPARKASRLDPMIALRSE
jgi:predicted permease